MESVKLIGYKDSGNIGDAIQTIALQRFLESIGITCEGYEFRGAIHQDMFCEQPNNLIVNGWHRGIKNKNPHTFPKRAIFVGLHAGAAQIETIDKDIMIGCRDTYTYNIAKELGYKAIITGCPTSSLFVKIVADSRSERRVVNIDYPSTYHAQSTLTQRIDSNMPWNVQMGHGLERLNTYIGCNKIRTSRLHVFLPCLALGVNVELDFTSTSSPERFTVIDSSEFENKTYNKDIVRQNHLSGQLRNRWIDGFNEVLAVYKP